MEIETAELYAEVILGEDADLFFKTEIGKYILARSKEQTHEATEELKNIEFFKSQEIAQLQMKIKIAELAIKWLNDMFVAGRQALQLLDQGE